MSSAFQTALLGANDSQGPRLNWGPPPVLAAFPPSAAPSQFRNEKQEAEARLQHLGDDKGMIRLKGSQHLRQRLVLATVTGKSIRIDDIRARDLNPGLRDFEASFLRLLEKLTDGCVVEINETGKGYVRSQA